MFRVVKLSKLEKEWAGSDKTLGSTIKKVFTPKIPVKRRIITAIYKIRSMISKLDVFIERLKERDRMLFERVVEALTVKDETRAKMYAGEVAQIRKIIKQLTITQVALEQISLRLETIHVFGDVIAGLVPVIGVVKELKGILKGILPEMSLELAEVEEVLRDLVIEVGEVTGVSVGDLYASPEARKILEEAKVIAEQRMKEKFPELPAVPTPTSETVKAESG